ncbi:ribonuclease H-like domain-containing protein [Aspergillus venezuelensis]
MVDLPSTPPSLYVDAEGVNLSRHGTVSILQIYHLPQDKVHLIDTFILGKTTFETPATAGKNKATNFKDVLEDPLIPKAFFDVRNDSDALYAKNGIHLAGITDIQLLEVVIRDKYRGWLCGLSKCIDRDADMYWCERNKAAAIKNHGKQLFSPDLGGSFEVFNARPMSADIMAYCAQDVRLPPKLWEVYTRRPALEGCREKVEMCTWARVDVCLEEEYDSSGLEKARSPGCLVGGDWDDDDEWM